jgi:uncharacterized LabA/DUF88 family protein
MSQKLTASLYVDNQNVKINLELANLLLVFAKIQGIVKQAKIYDFWPNNGKNAVLENLANLGFQGISVTSPIKDCADYQLVFDSLTDFDANGWPDLVILVSGDGDFCPFVNHLKKIGIKTIIFARKGNVKKQLMDLADEFHFLDELPELVVIQDAPENQPISELVAPKIDNLANKLPEVNPQVSSLPDPDLSAEYITYDRAIDSLIQAIKTASIQNNPTTFSTLNLLMCSNPNYPTYQSVASIRKPDGSKFKKFTNFIEAAVSDGKVRIKQNGNIQEVFLIESAAHETASDISDSETNQISADSINSQAKVADYIPYDQAVNCLLEAINTCLLEGHITDLSYIDRLMRYNHRFPNYQGFASIRKPDGKKFPGFLEFIQAVEKDGKVIRRKIKKITALVLADQKDSEIYDNLGKSKSNKKTARTITYEEATQCLLEAIKAISKKNKCTQVSRLDSIMRSNPRFPNYQGVTSIKGHNGKVFSQLSKFIEAVEEERKIKISRSKKRIKYIVLL